MLGYHSVRISWYDRVMKRQSLIWTVMKYFPSVVASVKYQMKCEYWRLYCFVSLHTRTNSINLWLEMFYSVSAPLSSLELCWWPMGNVTYTSQRLADVSNKWHFLFYFPQIEHCSLNISWLFFSYAKWFCLLLPIELFLSLWAESSWRVGQ
jgi:hypothetical protein